MRQAMAVTGYVEASLAKNTSQLSDAAGTIELGPSAMLRMS
jgi:hypothetical protein